MAASIGLMSYSLSAQETVKGNSNQVKTQQELDAHRKVYENDKSIQNSKDQNRTDTMNVGYMNTDHIAMQNGSYNGWKDYTDGSRSDYEKRN